MSALNLRTVHQLTDVLKDRVATLTNVGSQSRGRDAEEFVIMGECAPRPHAMRADPVVQCESDQWPSKIG